MVLIGVVLIIVGFICRINPMVVVTVSAIITGLLGGMNFHHIIVSFGEAFTRNRYMSILLLMLPIISR